MDSHAAAGGNLTPVSEPGDLRPGEAVDPRRVDESALALRYSLGPLGLHKAAHVWQDKREEQREKGRQRKLNINTRRGKCCQHGGEARQQQSR